MSGNVVGVEEFDAVFGAKAGRGSGSSTRLDPEVVEADFRRCGLRPEHARSARRGLEMGTYGSFEEAAVWLDGQWAPGNRQSRVLPSVVAEMAGKYDRQVGRQLEEKQLPTAARGRQVVERASAASTRTGTLNLCLITAGQGSSGYYPAEVLEQASRDRVFGQGLHLFLDHPTSDESYARPERSVRDIAGTLTADATYRDGGLFAPAQLVAAAREVLSDDLLPHLGLSIRAHADMDGSTVTRIVSAESVDFVTRAGRGGHVVSESDEAGAGRPVVSIDEFDTHFDRKAARS